MTSVQKGNDNKRRSAIRLFTRVCDCDGLASEMIQRTMSLATAVHASRGS